MSTGVAISSVTLSASTSSISFNNIPQTYTDLVLVFNGTHTGAGLAGVYLDKINTDGSTKYSRTIMYGTGSTVGADRSSDSTSANIGLINSTMSDSTFHFMDYANTKTFKTILARSNSASGQVRAGVALWRNISAITSFGLSGVTFAAGSTFSLYGINAENSGQAKAAGGDTIVRDSSYWYHVFYKSGTFTPSQSINAEILAIAGGGGGGGTDGGGGGAGGLIFWSNQTISTASTVTVGAGGVGGVAYNIGTSGSNSTFASLTAAVGGGRGGGGSGPVIAGTAGGSGGGGAGNTGGGGGAGGASTQTGSGATSYYGNAGGTGAPSDPPRLGAGGGGAGAAGGNGLGNGGAGRNSITGTTLSDWTNTTKTGVSGYFAGGGGGGSQGYGVGSGGAGGGGIGGDGGNGGNATQNTGSGGGGGGNDQGGGSGGSGIVIVRYPV